MTEKGTASIPLTAKELAQLQKVAERDGITIEEAATNLVKQELARRAGKKGGRLGRVLPLRTAKKI